MLEHVRKIVIVLSNRWMLAFGIIAGAQFSVPMHYPNRVWMLQFLMLYFFVMSNNWSCSW